jgi:polysaccharide biosynthesis protein PelF
LNFQSDSSSVLLATEGTYPFYTGGVSTWCHRLTSGLTNFNFRLLSVVSNPYPRPKYELAPNVLEVIKVPQWGLLQPAEFSHHQTTSTVLAKYWSTTPRTIANRFRPLFESLLLQVLSPQRDKEELGQVLLGLYEYFQEHDYRTTMDSIHAWNIFQHAARAAWEQRPHGTEHPSLAEMKAAYRFFYHLLIVLHFPTPRVDLCHSSAASFCGLPCVMAKLIYGTPYLLTEHGVYLREQYLNLGRQIKSFFVRWFLYRLVETVVQLNYYFADRLSPVCAYNSRWEKRMGVPHNRIEVIFNGVDPERFHPYPRSSNHRPVVSTVGLVYSLKGQLDLIEATALLKPRFPNVDVRLYGAANDRKYFNQCQQRVSELHLQNHVTFAGNTKEPWKVYSGADVIAFPSVSEGFPYALIEAMLCGASIVATDVGGVREALEGCGLLVPARAPEQLAVAIAFLLENDTERERLGRLAQRRALECFTEKKFLACYENTYRTMISPRQRRLVRAIE